MEPSGGKRGVLIFLLTGIILAVGIYGAVFYKKNYQIGWIFNALQYNIRTATTSVTAIESKNPEVLFSVFKSTKKNVFIVTWSNLPEKTTVLNVYRVKKGGNDWSL